MKNAYFLDNPFWRNQEKTEAMSILVIEEEGQKPQSKQMALKEFKEDGTPDPMWEKLMKEQGPEVLDRNTEERRIRKIREQNEDSLKKIQKEKSAKLEHLFALKLTCFEIQEVRDCPDKSLKIKLRSSRNEIEMQGWVSVILLKSLEGSDNEK